MNKNFVCTYFLNGEVKTVMVQAHDLVHASRIVQRVLKLPALAIFSISTIGRYTGPATHVITDNRHQKR